ncbi:SHC-transforming protein 2 [Tupaia chinensis]|uniref:SHC-transforming protein 2 n=1 Tax=Tupaia chinensis TaxID=246437 RepID=L8XZ15_TUPCH|nr:SHC-transforming protein 2 [Tupaia chinensis]
MEPALSSLVCAGPCWPTLFDAGPAGLPRWSSALVVCAGPRWSSTLVIHAGRPRWSSLVIHAGRLRWSSALVLAGPMHGASFWGGGRRRAGMVSMCSGSGPGSCLLPSAVGRFNQDCTRVASPACSRTRKSGEAPPPDCSPGPIYLLDPKVTRFGRSCTPAYSMQGRGKTRGLEVTPGPGAYSPEKAPPVHQRTPPAFSLGSRLRPRPRDTSAPAPNAYTMPPLWGSQVFIKPSYPSYSVVGRTAPARPPQDPAEIPGPGQYNSPDPNTYRQRWPAFTMLGRPRAPRPLDETPGPGTHSPEQVTVNKARAPAYTMGIRHSTRAATVRPASPRAPSHRQLPPPRRPPALGGPSLRLEGEARRASGVAAPSFPGSELSEYMGCIEVVCSMRSLDFNTRTQVTREAINRLHEAVPGVRGSWKKKAPNKALASVLGKSNLRFAGMSVSVNISTDGLNLSVPATRQTIANHHMQSISFASGGDTDMADYVAYVAKDPINQRACHILECCEGLAQTVISTVGQAFELRFKQYLHSPPKVAVPPERPASPEEEAAEHNYYNSVPGKEPPPGGLVDSRLAPLQPCAPGAFGGLGQDAAPAQRDACGLQWELGPSGAGPVGLHEMLVCVCVCVCVQVAVTVGAAWPPAQDGCGQQLCVAPAASRLASSWRRDRTCEPTPASPLPSPGLPGDGYVLADTRGPQDYEEHLYVNTQGLDAPELEGSPKKDLFDMRPFEDALKLHECLAAAPLPSEDQWPSPPTRRAPVAPTEDQLRQEPWYHGRMSRRAAEKLLRADGDFLVRDSVTNPGQYVLTGMHAGQPRHLLLVDPEGVVRTKDVLFESIGHLIEYHLQNGQPIVAAESELHLRGVVLREP